MQIKSAQKPIPWSGLTEAHERAIVVQTDRTCLGSCGLYVSGESVGGTPVGDLLTGHCPGHTLPAPNPGPLRLRIARPVTHDPEFRAKPPCFHARFSKSRCFAQIYGNQSVLRGAGCTRMVNIPRRKPVSYGGLPGGSKKRPVSGAAPPAECPIPLSEKSCGYHPSRQRIGCLHRYTISGYPVLQKIQEF